MIFMGDDCRWCEGFVDGYHGASAASQHPEYMRGVDAGRGDGERDRELGRYDSARYLPVPVDPWAEGGSR